MKKIISIAVVILIAVVALFSLHTTTPKSQVASLSIGAVLHLTGDQAEPAQAFREGIELAVEEHNINASNPTKVTFIVEDDKLQPKEAYSAAKKLIEVDHVTAAIDASYLEAMANGPLFESSHIPVVTIWDANTDIENIGKYVFGIGVWTPSSAETAAGFTVNTLKKRKVAVINTQNEWSQTAAGYFENKIKEYGGTVVFKDSVSPSTRDFRSVITKMLAQKPDVVYAPITDGVVEFFTQYKQLAGNIPVINSDIISDAHITAAPAVFENIYQTQPADPSYPATRTLLDKYKKKYGKETNQVLYTAWGYDAARLILGAIESGNVTSDSINNSIAIVKNFDGATGSITMSEKGSAPKYEKMFQIRKGKFVLAE